MSEIQDNTYPLTAAQSGMWFAQFLDPTNPSLRVAECLEIHGPIDPVLFKGSSAPVEQPLPRRTSRARRHRRPVPAAAAIPVTVPRSPGSARTPAPPPPEKSQRGRTVMSPDPEELATRPGPRSSDQRHDSDPAAVPKHHQPLRDNAAVLRECAAETRRDLLRLPGGDVEIFTVGDGPPLVLMHPLNIGAGVFAWQFAGLAERYRVICVHNPGVGATTWNEDITMRGLAWFHHMVLEELSVEPPFHVLGACFGGNVAQEFALLHPADCASLVLVGSYPPGDRDGGPRPLLVTAREEFDLMSGTGGQGLEGERAVLEDLLLRSESMNTWFALAYLQAFAANPSPLDRLPEIVAPTLILRGQLDTMMSPRHAVALREAIPGAEFIELASTGHFPYLTHRDMFNCALISFLTHAGKITPLSN